MEELAEAELDRLKQPFRIVVPIQDSSDVYPVATVGLDREGAVFVAPVAVNGDGWHFARLVPGRGPLDEQTVPESDRPKLHWHKSGFVSATRSGTQLPKNGLKLGPPFRQADPRVLLFVRSPFGFAQPSVTRKRDVIISAHDRGLPLTELGVEISWVLLDPERHTYTAKLGPIGLVRGDCASWVVPLCGNRIQLAMKCTNRVGTGPLNSPEEGISVLATDSAAPATVFALWSDRIRNPRWW